MDELAPDVVTAVVEHMNGDHADDSLVIVRGFVDADAEWARMTTLDRHRGTWAYASGGDERSASLPWPFAPIVERADIRRAVVTLHRDACRRLGVEPRTH